MMQQGFIAIELSPVDANYFVMFQKHYKKVKYLIEKGVFDHMDGSVEIHIDSGGHWKNVKLVKNNYPQDEGI